MLGIPYNIEEVGQATMALDLFQGLYPSPPIRQISFDTRNINHGEQTIFVALKTSHRDGHDFIEDAIQKGVKHFLVERPISYKNVNYAICQNTLESLQFWAAYHRSRFDYPVIGITGSNGKTIVKEWLTTLLEQEFQIVKSPMSYNSQLGVSLSILQMYPDADMAIIEAGISKPEEMEVLEAIIKPTIGILTHMGSAHAEGFDSEIQKLEEKSKLFTNTETIIASSKQKETLTYLRSHFENLKTIGEESDDSIQVFLSKNESEIILKEKNKEWPISLPLSGEGDAENMLLAILAAKHLGADMEMVRSQISLLHPVSMRMEMITDNPEITIINDSYNSDIDSVRNAFHYLMRTEGHSGKQIIISDIPNQGTRQIETQRKILEEAIELVGADRVRTVGEVFEKISHKHHYKDTEALIRDLQYDDFIDSTVLLKGARSFEFERSFRY